MDQEKKVSIIVPVYNVENLLKRCIDSILNQVYKNIQIVLIDDGSTDTSKEICDYYATIDRRVFVYHQENQGISAARNKGLEIALKDMESCYIFFLDSDDTINLNSISECVRLLEEENAEMVIGGYSGIGINGDLRWSIIPQGVRKYTGVELLRKDEKDIPSGLVWCNLYKKECWNEIRFPIGHKYEDNWVMPEILMRVSKVVTYPGSIYNYYENKNSFMHTEMTNNEYQMRLDLYWHLILLFSRNDELSSQRIRQMEYYMNCMEMCHQNKIDIGEKYDHIYKEVIKQFIKAVKGIKLKRKIKVIIRETLRGWKHKTYEKTR